MQSKLPQGDQFRTSKRTMMIIRRLGLVIRQRRWQMSTVIINLAIYTVLVVTYFFVVLQWLNEPLAQLFQKNMVHYALVSVVLILGQGILLDVITSSLLRLAKWVNGTWRK